MTRPVLDDQEKRQLCDILDKLRDHAEEVRAFEGWELGFVKLNFIDK